MKPSIKIIIVSGLILFFVFPFFCPADNTSFEFNKFFMNYLPGGFFYPTYIENYAPDTIFHIEESNGFAFIDNPKVYFEGDSFIQFNWFYNDFNINSVLDEGSPAVQIPFSSLSHFKLQGESPTSDGYGLHFVSEIPEKSHSTLSLSSIYSELGGIFPWASFLITNPAIQRDDRLYDERRQNLSNFFIDYGYSKKFRNSNFMLSFNYFDIQRQFNDFNKLNGTFEESGKLLLFNSGYKKKLKQGTLEISAAFNYLDRSNLDAELGRYPQETFNKEKYSFFTGLRLKKKSYDLKVSFLNEHENLNSFDPDFYKDLLDNDGDGFLVFGKMGAFNGRALNIDLNIPVQPAFLSKNLKIKSFFDFRYTHTSGDETNHDYNAILFDNSPYLVYQWNVGEEYTHSSLLANLGIDLSVEISRNLSIFSKLWLNYNTLNFSFNNNDLGFVSPGFDIGIMLFKNKNPEILIAYGHMPYDLRENVSNFLETNRPTGTIYYWEDQNNDLVFQSGEEGSVYGYSGGNYHFLDDDISRPYKHRFLLNISTRISKNWSLTVKGIYKKIINNFWVQFDQDYGFYVNQEGYDLYFFNSPFKNYYLTNEDFEEDPFYAQLLLYLKGGKKDKWFFSFSFMAQIGMGYTAFGNGPGTNDIGIIDESQANPNSWINGYGRLDGDRAFVGRLYFGFYIFKDLFMGVALKYRDGNPFAFINSTYDYNQVVLYYSTIKAEDDRGVKGGPREDYLGDVSVQFNYKFKMFKKDACLSLAFFNILDVGYELSEYVFSGGSRDAMELNIPPSLRLTFIMNF